MISTQWSSALSDLQEAQKREYQEWVAKVHEDLVRTSSKAKGILFNLLFVFDNYSSRIGIEWLVWFECKQTQEGSESNAILENFPK